MFVCMFACLCYIHHDCTSNIIQSVELLKYLYFNSMIFHIRYLAVYKQGSYKHLGQNKHSDFKKVKCLATICEVQMSLYKMLGQIIHRKYTPRLYTDEMIIVPSNIAQYNARCVTPQVYIESPPPSVIGSATLLSLVAVTSQFLKCLAKASSHFLCLPHALD